MQEVINEVNKLGVLKRPLEIATASTVLCLASRKLLGMKLGINCETASGAMKAFGATAVAVAIVEWLDPKPE